MSPSRNRLFLRPADCRSFGFPDTLVAPYAGRHELRSGQTLILVLLFLIPMVLAFGLAVRTNHAVVLKIRAQQAADAGALAAGSKIARVMNQIALHNMCIFKYHCLMAAMDCAIAGAETTKTMVTAEWKQAGLAWTRWMTAVDLYALCCPPVQEIPCREGPIGPVECLARWKQAIHCVSCLSQQTIYWKRISDYWDAEIRWLKQQKASFQTQLGPMVAEMGKKSQALVESLDDEIVADLDRVAKAHHLDNKKEFGDKRGWCYLANKENVLKSGEFVASKLLKKTDNPVEYSAMALTGGEPTGKAPFKNKLLAGILHFEGPPPKVDVEVSDQNAKLRKQPEPWGPTGYFLEYIYNVHFGVPGYFQYQIMHGPLGNPDSKHPNCGGDKHNGCDYPAVDARSANSAWKINPSGQKSCWRDWTVYSRDFAKTISEGKKATTTLKEFSGMKETMFRLADQVDLSLVVTARIRANQGFFSRLFPAKTVDHKELDYGTQSEEPFFYATSKFELYNLTETDGQIPKPEEYDSIPKTLMAQDWRAILAPITEEEHQGHRLLPPNVRH